MEPIGISGDLALMWKEEVKVKILYSDRRMIDAKVVWQDKEFYLTGYMGTMLENVEEQYGRDLVELELPWMVLGC